MAAPIPEDEPVTTATLFSSRMGGLLSFFFRQHVYEERRRPGEEVGAVSLAGDRVEVLVETFLPAELDDALPQAIGVLAIAVVLQPAHEKPVYVQPHRPPPVRDGREAEAVYVVARHRRYAFVGEAEPVVLQGIDQAFGPLLVGDAGEQGREVRGEIDLYR